MRSGRRALVGICAGLLAAAAALWGASPLTWYTADVQAAGRGTVAVAATGADLAPALTGVAALAVAGVAAAVALAGMARRALGAVLVLAGAWVAVVVVHRISTPPAGGALASLPAAPAGAADPTGVALTPAPLLAAGGAVMLLAVGGALVVVERGLPRFGARYAAPAARARPADPDRAAWEDLDAGRDPTVEQVDRKRGGGGAGAGLV